MAAGGSQPRWDIYEAVLLLDGYLESLQPDQSRARVVKRLSDDLRRMAVNRGIEIDDTYRNVNGVSLQMQSMDSAFKGKKVFVNTTRQFFEAVELYRTDNKRYLTMLEKAKSMTTAIRNNRNAFLAWATSTYSARRCKWIEYNILKMEQFAVAEKLMFGSIFDITDVETLERISRIAQMNRIFHIRNREFIKNIIDDFQAYMQFCLQIPRQVG